MTHQKPTKAAMKESEKNRFAAPDWEPLLNNQKAESGLVADFCDDGDDVQLILRGDKSYSNRANAKARERRASSKSLTACVGILLIIGLVSVGAIYYQLFCRAGTAAITTSSPPPECAKVVEYTQSWRLDHNGTDKKPKGPHSKDGYACDFYHESPWFRFSGEGGSKMLNSCPPMKSCGTYLPFWTDYPAPHTVGTPIAIKVYGAYTKCRAKIVDVKVMRCSMAPNDIIYKYDDAPYDSCFYAFCGMK